MHEISGKDFINTRLRFIIINQYIIPWNNHDLFKKIEKQKNRRMNGVTR